MFGLGKKYPFVVTILHSGRHPYMGDPTYDMFEGLKQENVHVMARNYDHAKKVAMGWDSKGVSHSKVRSWRRTALSIQRENAGESLNPGRAALFYRCGQR